MAADDLVRFRQLVLADGALQAQLQSLPSRSEFVRRTVELADAAGCAVTAEDVEEALITSRRAWFERWI